MKYTKVLIQVHMHKTKQINFLKYKKESELFCVSLFLLKLPNTLITVIHEKCLKRSQYNFRRKNILKTKVTQNLTI